MGKTKNLGHFRSSILASTSGFLPTTPPPSATGSRFSTTSLPTTTRSTSRPLPTTRAASQKATRATKSGATGRCTARIEPETLPFSSTYHPTTGKRRTRDLDPSGTKELRSQRIAADPFPVSTIRSNGKTFSDPFRRNPSHRKPEVTRRRPKTSSISQTTFHRPIESLQQTKIMMCSLNLSLEIKCP